MAGRLRKPPVMGGFFQRRENEVEIDNKISIWGSAAAVSELRFTVWGLTAD